MAEQRGESFLAVSRRRYRNWVRAGATDRGRKQLTEPPFQAIRDSIFLVYVLPGAYWTEIKAQQASVTKDL